MWKGAIIKNTKKITFEILQNDLRSVNATADFIEFKNVIKVEVSVNIKKEINLLFNTFENIDEKILRQQFHSESSCVN